MGTTAKARLFSAVRCVVRSGGYPGPSAILRALGRNGDSSANGGPSLGGRETRWRREALLELGWTEDGGWPKKRFAWRHP
jgi:hypothetical protein